MKIVLDTNILVSALSDRSNAHWVIRAFLAEKYTLVISHEILIEYEEVLLRKYNLQVVNTFLSAMKESENVEMVEIYFQWKLLRDPDDNKFVDTAIASGADYIISEDNDFNSLQNIDFPKVGILRLRDFEKILNQI